MTPIGSILVMVKLFGKILVVMAVIIKVFYSQLNHSHFNSVLLIFIIFITFDYNYLFTSIVI